ncbi:hypothetical protein ONZ43_g6991 [Nemania bipapillata]|uniref:Uncharacterized protein n=1 Tax=Nemania bipapillata TaxID=110536 RepID=A0ACC2HUA0_9PEZI|nr:hypothetical protein ONZ43_g6991 [Nemania bipapillata]
MKLAIWLQIPVDDEIFDSARHAVEAEQVRYYGAVDIEGLADECATAERAAVDAAREFYFLELINRQYAALEVCMAKAMPPRT